jgi:hypothetical protein
MSNGEGKTPASFAERARDLGINVLVFSGVQTLVALLAWQLLFRDHPQGFAMGLSLVGFAAWGLAFLLSFRRPARPGIRPMGRTTPPPSAQAREGDTAPGGRLQAQLGTAGCGTVLFLSGLVALGLAFVLRVRADMQAGMTWSDIFPMQP